MLQNLTNAQVEQAFEWLASPIVESPPEALTSLNQMEWFLLQRMLDELMKERDHNPLQ